MLSHFRIVQFVLFGLVFAAAIEAAERTNVLFITVDDMNWDSVGAYGCRVPDITPNIDKLASQGIRFQHAHVTIAICQPTRAVWMTGRYPHNSGALGFNRINAGVPTLVEALEFLRSLRLKLDSILYDERMNSGTSALKGFTRLF